MVASILFMSLQVWLAVQYHMVQQKWPLYTTWYGHGHLVSGGPCYVWLAEPRGSTQIKPSAEAWNLTQCYFLFLHNTVINMLRGLFDDHKYMDIYLPIHQEYSYLGKQKISVYFSASTCKHLWPSPSHLVNCAKCLHNPSKDVADWSVGADFKSLLNFKFFWGKIWLSQTSLFLDM